MPRRYRPGRGANLPLVDKKLSDLIIILQKHGVWDSIEVAHARGRSCFIGPLRNGGSHGSWFVPGCRCSAAVLFPPSEGVGTWRRPLSRPPTLPPPSARIPPASAARRRRRHVRQRRQDHRLPGRHRRLRRRERGLCHQVHRALSGAQRVPGCRPSGRRPRRDRGRRRPLRRARRKRETRRRRIERCAAFLRNVGGRGGCSRSFAPRWYAVV